MVRSCSPWSAVSACPDAAPAAAANLCSSYTAQVYTADIGAGTVYRNPHCALCNNVTAASLVCIKLEGRRVTFLNPFKPQSFAVLSDISGPGEVGVEARCSNSEIWDPFFRKCR